MASIVSVTFVSFIFLLVVGLYLRSFTHRSLKNLQGPPSPSWLLGHEVWVRYQDEVGDLEYKWTREYGTAFRVAGCYGKDTLMLADPRGLQYVLHTSGYHFPKRVDARMVIKLLTGRGLTWVSGHAHQRQRKIMNPAFTAPQLRTFLPLFQHSASRLTTKWKEELHAGAKTMNVTRWLSKVTLDSIGESAFDYRFHALDNQQNELSVAFENLFADSLLYPPTWDILFKALWKYIPNPILRFVEFIPTREYLRFRTFLQLTKTVAKELVDQKTANILTETPSRDMLSILVRSNLSEDPHNQLDRDEMLSQMSTLMLGGTETIASTLGWILLDLARHPGDQTRVREEIASFRAKIDGTGGLTAADLDTMPFTTAVIKESLRLSPIIPFLYRQVDRNDVIPLSSPIMTESGQVISEIPISKGQDIIISIGGYNRLTSVWGEDADQWNPSRFLDAAKAKQISIGVYANLLNFSAGIRGCIGWRYAILQIHTLLIELIQNFQFDRPSGVEIQRVPAGMMVSMVRGKIHEGSQMPLSVSLVEE